MTAVADALTARAVRSTFYVWIGLAATFVAFVGFLPTYWVPLAQGSFYPSTLVHIHGAVFFAWPLFLTYQAWLVSSGQVFSHREVGLIGIALASVMTMLGITVAILAAVRFISAGFASEAEAFLIVPTMGILFFAITFGFAIANVRRIEWHRRLVLVATASLLEAPVARWFLTFLAPPGAPSGPPPPVSVALMPAIVGDLLILAAIVYDWRSRGRPHPAYLIAGGALLSMQLLREPLSRTHVWENVAMWLVSIG